MSQTPQPPYPQQPGSPPPGNYPPPGGVPPMGYAPPDMQGRGSNVWGITSLITGIVGFCVPFVGGLLAILFGFLGIAKARKTRAGMALSIVGLVLGLISLGVYILFGGAIFAVIQGTAVNRDVARQFITDLSKGDIAAATADSDGTINPGDMNVLAREAKGFGTLTDVTTLTTNVQNDDAVLGGIASYGQTKKAFEMHQTKVAGKWKVSYFGFK